MGALLADAILAEIARCWRYGPEARAEAGGRRVLQRRCGMALKPGPRTEAERPPEVFTQLARRRA